MMKSMTMTSTAFADGASIPVKYTCDGDSVSPPLQWDEPPAGTQSLALIVDDPDAPSGTFVHWVIYGLPPTLRGLPEGVSTDAQAVDGRDQRQQRRRKAGLHGALSAERHAPLSLQALRPRQRRSTRLPAGRRTSSFRRCRTTYWRRAS